ncbi:MAG: STAS domain-containing protein [Treponema sp.]|mgnify:CR=1 FL=1|nr:STAS domain-containing protein [Treponema sp.]MCR4631345.1 STAS domain-containing protein [Treponema sp.]
MDITVNKAQGTIELIVKGRLDTTTAPQLETKVKEVSKEKVILYMNLQGVEYISSAGLRVVLLAQKMMIAVGGKMILRSPSEFCRQVFEATGMDAVLTIE